MRRLLPVLLALILVACCAHQGPPRVATAPPPCQCLYTYTYDIAPGFSEADRWAILDGMQVWRLGTGDRACWVPAKAAQRPQVTFRRASRLDLAIYLPMTWGITAGLWQAGTGTIFIVVEQGLITRTIAIHEMGHAMGLAHTAKWERGLPSFMHPSIDEPTMPRAPYAQLPMRDLFGFCEQHACECRP